MLSTFLSSLVILGGASLASAADATFATVLLNPGGLGPLSGSVMFTAAGEGVNVALAISGFPSEGGPFPYHGTLSISML